MWPSAVHSSMRGSHLSVNQFLRRTPPYRVTASDSLCLQDRDTQFVKLYGDKPIDGGTAFSSTGDVAVITRNTWSDSLRS